MKVFWIIIALLAAGSTVLFLPGGDADSADTPARPASQPETRPMPGSAPEPETEPEPEPEPQTEAEETSPAPTEQPGLAELAEEHWETSTETASDLEIEEPVVATGEDSQQPFEIQFPDSTDEPAQHHSNPAHAEGAPLESAPALNADDLFASITGEKPDADAIETSGTGTSDDPFVVQWASFLSARETYNPQEGKDEIPESIQELNGKTVAIDGYVLFPLASETPSELLVMFNQWDGCCIGVPPSPYDAIEVALKEPVQGAVRFAASGRIVGTLKIDPYVVQDWLIGLYLIEDAVFEPTGL